jgi:branched-chain amino acid transport system substrate-binding protein
MTNKLCRRLAGSLAAIVLPFSTASAAQTVGPVTDEIGVIRIPKGAPIQIGGSWVLSGPDTASGLDQKRAVEIAFKQRGGKLLDHPLKLNAEDDLCNAEGGQTVGTRLASNPQTVIVLGSACSSAATPEAPILWQAGIVDICTSCTAPSLTATNRKPESAGFARTVYSTSSNARPTPPAPARRSRRSRSSPSTTAALTRNSSSR